MLNEFLTSTLQIVIVLDVLGVVAWYVLAAWRASPKTVMSSPTTMSVASPVTLWGKLTGSTHPLQSAPAQRVGQSLDDSLGQLRRVLDSYRSSLA